jgi:hypothetical protein
MLSHTAGTGLPTATLVVVHPLKEEKYAYQTCAYVRAVGVCPPYQKLEYIKKQITNSVALSPQANYTD